MKRRSFLKLLGMGLAAVVLGPRLPKPAVAPEWEWEATLFTPTTIKTLPPVSFRFLRIRYQDEKTHFEGSDDMEEWVYQPSGEESVYLPLWT